MPTEPAKSATQEILDGAEDAFRRFHRTVAEDSDYPALHLAPPVGRLNDPNGLVFHHGIYHAFYQYTPEFPLRRVFWGHAVSTDLANWSDKQNALSPVDYYDRNGCYSGSAYIAPDDTVEFFYTGNVKHADGTRETSQNLAITRDFSSFEKSPLNPLITGTPSGYTTHFRDPFVYTRNGRYYALIGAQRENLTGAVVLYSSDDRRRWEFEGEIDFSDSLAFADAYMIECPLLTRLTDCVTGEPQDVMIFCPQGLEPSGEKYNNKFQAGYVVGRLRGTYFDVSTPFTELDAGFEFYAPQIFHGVDNQHRALMLAWCGIPDLDGQPSTEKNWLHTMTLPRHISVRDGVLYQEPVETLDDILQLEHAELDSSGYAVEVADQRVFRISGEVELSDNSLVLQIEDEQGVAISCEIRSDQCTVNRTHTRYICGGSIRTRTLPRAQRARKFELVVDASITELFIDGGHTVFSARTFFHGKKRRIRFISPAGQRTVQEISNLAVAVLEE